MSKLTDIRPVAAELYLLPAELRVPLKFGSEVTTVNTCARMRVTVEDRAGRRAEGWGETPLAVQWSWPSDLAYSVRYRRMEAFCQRLIPAWLSTRAYGHPLEIGYDFIQDELPGLAAGASEGEAEPIPWLTALVCASAFDIALHDALGVLHGCDVYRTYTSDWLNRDLADFIAPAEGNPLQLRGRYVDDFLIHDPPRRLAAWHLVGGLDPLDDSDRTGNEPLDGYPITLADWMDRDGLTSLKIKLRGTEAAWDYQRLARVGAMALERKIEWLSADFNCLVMDPAYVIDILERLAIERPEIYERIRYVEQPFPYDLDAHPIDVRGVSRLKPLFLDESAHDWQHVCKGHALGWTGVALKTCKTQTGALLSMCWAKAHGMPLMVQDLTNPMLALIPHVRLAAHAGTIRGVEVNAMQFYPEVSQPEAAVHPGLYRRRDGMVDLSTLGGAGFGYRLDAIERRLPPAVLSMDSGRPADPASHCLSGAAAATVSGAPPRDY